MPRQRLTTCPPTLSGLTFTGPAPAETNGSAPGPAQSGSREYSRQLTALNCSVRDWISKHVDDNPLCDLNPIFRDYERHLASIERQYGADGSEEKKAPPPSSSSFSAAPAATLFSFSKKPSEDSSSAPPPAGVTFNFGQKVDGSLLGSLAPKTPPSFSFSSSPSQTSLFGAGTKSEETKCAGRT